MSKYEGFSHNQSHSFLLYWTLYSRKYTWMPLHSNCKKTKPLCFLNNRRIVGPTDGNWNLPRKPIANFPESDAWLHLGKSLLTTLIPCVRSSDIIAPWFWNAYREEHWALHIYLTHPNYILCLNWNDYSTLEGIFWGTDAIKIHNIGLSGEWEYHISYYATALDWIQRHRCTAEANISTQLNTFRNLNYICLLYTHSNRLTP